MPVYLENPVVDVLDWSLRLLAKSPSIRSAVNKLHKMNKRDLPRYPSLATWTTQETKAFDRALDDYDDELLEFRSGLPEKTMPEIVHHYYRFKG